MTDFADDPRVKARGKIRRIIPANAELALTDDEWSAALEDVNETRVKAIEDNLPMIMFDDVRFLLEDWKRLIGEVKRIESYCAEVEIARRAAESEVAGLFRTLETRDNRIDELESEVARLQAVIAAVDVQRGKRIGEHRCACRATSVPIFENPAVFPPGHRYSPACEGRAALNTGSGEAP